MKGLIPRVTAFLALIVGASPALAEQGPWGTPEETKPCQASLDSPECKAEISRRAENCLKDPREDNDMGKWKEQGYKSQAEKEAQCKQFCINVATDILKRQMAKLEENAKRAAAAKAELESVELPKAEMKHDAKLEKAVADAYLHDYETKALKVILLGWKDEYEKDAFGRVTGRDLDAWVVTKLADGRCWLHGELWLQHGNGRSFSGPFSARGAGSASDQEILCSKLEGAASSPAGTGGKKKK